MILDIPYNYWAYFGTFYLIVLTWQDFAHKMLIDDRYNYFMMGMSISLYSHISRNLKYIAVMIAVLIVWNIILKKTKAMGDGDVSAINWIWIGFAIIDPFHLFWYIIIFSSCTLVYYIFKILVFKYNKPQPFFLVILLSFIVSCGIFGLY